MVKGGIMSNHHGALATSVFLRFAYKFTDTFHCFAFIHRATQWRERVDTIKLNSRLLDVCPFKRVNMEVLRLV